MSSAESTLVSSNEFSNNTMSNLSSVRWVDCEDDVDYSTTKFKAWSGQLPISIIGKPTNIIQNTSLTPPLSKEYSFDRLLVNENKKNPVVDITDKYISADVRLADTVNDLKLYHYIHCDNSSSDDVMSSRGIIRCGDNIVCKTFGFTPEIVSSDVENVKSSISSFNQCKIYDAEEGATLRVFFHNNQWHLSTHRKINAYQSRWGSSSSRSFGDMFIDAIEWEVLNGNLKDRVKYESREDLFNRYCDILDRNKNYTFLVRNSKDNRIVCEAPTNPQIFFIGAFDRTTHLLLEGNDSGLNTPNICNFSSVDELINYVDNIDHIKKQGVIVYMPNQHQVKIMNPTYVKYFNARGNEPSIKFRYLQVRTDKDQVAMLYNLYPDFINEFEKYENILNNLGKKIHRSYVERFINGKYVSLPQQEYFIMQACHSWHTQDRIRNKISLDKVLSVIDSQTATSLNRMIKPYTLKNKPQNEVSN